MRTKERSTYTRRCAARISTPDTTPAAATHVAAAVTLRAASPQLDVLTVAERQLLSDRLDRIVAAGPAAER